MSTGLLADGAGLLWADQTQRDGGYLSSPTTTLSTAGYAMISDQIQLDTVGYQLAVDDVLGTARLQVTPIEATGDVFVGVARSEDVASYLSGVAYGQLSGLGRGGQDMRQMRSGMMTDRPGGPPAGLPAEMDIWVAQSSGPGMRTVEWVPADGN